MFFRIIMALLLVTVGSRLGWADDWPQWMGPQRDNVWREEGILKTFPADGPKRLWSTPVAGGYSGPAVAGDVVVVTDYVTSQDVKIENFERKTSTGMERVLCLDRKTGEVRWKHEYPVEYTISYPAGPRCTPIIENDRVYTLGAEGHLVCLNLGTGEVVWQHDFKAEFQTKSPLWGFSAHPLIDGDRLICIVGGEGSHAVAFNKQTGETIWTTVNAQQQGYSPPTIIEQGGMRQLILAHPSAVVGASPTTGEVLWSVPYEATNGSIIMSPIHWNDHLFVAGYSNKNLLLQFPEQGTTPTEVWRDKRKHAMSPVNVQPMLVDSVVYGIDQDGTFTAMQLPSGERLWETSWPISQRKVQTGTAFIVRHEQRFFLFAETGELVIAELTPTEYREIDRAKVIEPTNVAFGRSVVWCAPAFAGQAMFVRNDQECICVSLADEN